MKTVKIKFAQSTQTFIAKNWNSFSVTITLSLQLDDAAIQVYKDGDFGAYLDLESSLAEQSEEIEGLNAK